MEDTNSTLGEQPLAYNGLQLSKSTSYSSSKFVPRQEEPRQEEPKGAMDTSIEWLHYLSGEYSLQNYGSTLTSSNANRWDDVDSTTLRCMFALNSPYPYMSIIAMYRAVRERDTVNTYGQDYMSLSTRDTIPVLITRLHQSEAMGWLRFLFDARATVLFANRVDEMGLNERPDAYAWQSVLQRVGVHNPQVSKHYKNTLSGWRSRGRRYKKNPRQLVLEVLLRHPRCTEKPLSITSTMVKSLSSHDSHQWKIIENHINTSSLLHQLWDSCSSAVQALLKGEDLPHIQLESMPEENVDAIWQNSPHELDWQLRSVDDVANRKQVRRSEVLSFADADKPAS